VAAAHGLDLKSQFAWQRTLPRKLAQRVLNETLWNPAFFCCWKIEASQGWNGHVPAAIVFVAKCRRLGGSLAAGLQPAKKDSRFSTSCSASLLNATYWHLHRAVSVCLGLLPLLFKERAGVRFAALIAVLNHSSSLPSPLRGEGVNPFAGWNNPLNFLQYPLPAFPLSGGGAE